MGYARGKYAKAISDRSGMAFPYREMVKEWNGSFVHKSEFEPKHPQIKRKHIKSDRVALANARPQHKNPNQEFLLYISSGFFAEVGDSGINSGANMSVNHSNDILGHKLTALEVTSSVGTNFTVVIS
tara:strand:+ start:3184 stop:3564 length:381 start_codon:yes stop_codon:yes gene_type:complete